MYLRKHFLSYLVQPQKLWIYISVHLKLKLSGFSGMYWHSVNELGALS